MGSKPIKLNIYKLISNKTFLFKFINILKILLKLYLFINTIHLFASSHVAVLSTMTYLNKHLIAEESEKR